MTELEKYIRLHADEFDGMKPKEGHEERFLEKFAIDSPVKPANEGRVWRIIVTALATAAVIAGVFVTGSSFGHFTGRNPEAIYLAYMTEVSKLYKDSPMEDSASWDDALAQLTEEAVPLFEQLPEEMSRREKARVLKQYYGDLLDGAKQFVNK
jgi:hypothetical protein